MYCRIVDIKRDIFMNFKSKGKMGLLVWEYKYYFRCYYFKMIVIGYIFIIDDRVVKKILINRFVILRRGYKVSYKDLEFLVYFLE